MFGIIFGVMLASAIAITLLIAPWGGEMLFASKPKEQTTRLDIFDPGVTATPIPSAVLPVYEEEVIPTAFTAEEPVEQPAAMDYDSMTLKALYAYAKEHQIPVKSTDRKAEVIEKIKQWELQPA